MVAEPWILKMGNQVSSNLKHAFLDSSKKKPTTKKPQHSNQKIGILSFEVANVMSKTVYLHKSLTDNEISRLHREIFKCEGVRTLISSDDPYLLELVLAEKLDDLSRIVAVVSRLGKRCTEPALHGFEHVFGDVVSGAIDVKELGFLVKDMEGMIKKMERFVSSTANLYNETQVLSELELNSKKFQQTQHEESRRVFEQKLLWHRQDVKHLKDVSLWNQTFDKIVGSLARTVCTIYARMCSVFGDYVTRVGYPGFSELASEFSSGVVPSFVRNGSAMFSGSIDPQRRMTSGLLQPASSRSGAHDSGRIARVPVCGRETPTRPGMASQRNLVSSFRPEDTSLPCGASPGRLFMDCLRVSNSATLTLDDYDAEREGQDGLSGRSAASGMERGHPNPSHSFSGVQRRQNGSTPCATRSRFGPKSRLMVYASSSTVGGSALALHYANVIIVIEKLLRYPHLVGDEARDDLYQMLPTSLRMSLKKNLKAYAKNMAIYDAPLAHEWKEGLDKTMKWLAPLAHNMIRWQTERNLEQQQIVARTNVLLLQTLYFADRQKTETAISELLVGLNYICRYEHQQNALLDCASSFDFADCEEWRWQDPFL